MEKDILTIENIRYDLRKMIRANIVGAVVCAVFFALFTWLLFAVAADGLKFYKTFYAVVNTLLFSVLPVLFLIGTIGCIVDIYKLRSLYKRPGRIVKDRLVRKEIQEHLTRRHYYETCHLYFSSYGEYEIPGLNYSWSDLYAMDDSTTYMYADCDDEYYLILSKPHTGKILLAYNTKFFEIQLPQ